MTLPFRRRHHDDDAMHDRARALWSTAMLEPLTPDGREWLDRHLATCGECRVEHEAYEADRALLRGLRETMPEPPRDLWARTATALEHEQARRRRPGPRTREPDRPAARAFRGWPLGVFAATLVVAVVVGGSILSRPVAPEITPPQGSAPVAVVTPVPAATPISVAAADLGWIQSSDDGTFQLRFADVNQVCPGSRSDCGTLESHDSGPAIKLDSAPARVTISPEADQLIVVSNASAEDAGRILVVPVKTSGNGSSAPPVTAFPSISPASQGPSASPDRSGQPSAQPSGSIPDGALEIATGVAVIGEMAYSADGRWLAFSAAPSDGTAGPDLYLWSQGFERAVAVTSNHDTYFSGWLGDRILASRVVAEPAVPDEPLGSATPEPSADPSTRASRKPKSTAAVESIVPVVSPEPVPSVGRATSFLLDPVTNATVDLAEPDVWLPVVDPTGRFAAYWSGTLVRTADGRAWQLGTGSYVLDGWSAPLAPIEGSASPSVEPPAPRSPAATENLTPGPSASDPGFLPEGSPEPAEPVGPSGTRVTLVDRAGEVRARFDPSGDHLAIWVADDAGSTVGRLRLVTLDAATGTIDATQDPLPGAPAVRGFSIDEGRLAWVTPRGQDGQESSVQVLGWSGHTFGQVQTIPAKGLQIVR